MGYEREDRHIWVRFFAGTRGALLLHCVQTYTGTHTTSYAVSTRGPFLWGREADHSPSSRAVVKNAWSYISTPAYIFMAWCFIKLKESSPFIVFRRLVHLTAVFHASVPYSGLTKIELRLIRFLLSPPIRLYLQRFLLVQCGCSNCRRILMKNAYVISQSLFDTTNQTIQINCPSKLHLKLYEVKGETTLQRQIYLLEFRLNANCFFMNWYYILEEIIICLFRVVW
jgi:hypothetical protein